MIIPPKIHFAYLSTLILFWLLQAQTICFRTNNNDDNDNNGYYDNNNINNGNNYDYNDEDM